MRPLRHIQTDSVIEPAVIIPHERPANDDMTVPMPEPVRPLDELLKEEQAMYTVTGFLNMFKNLAGMHINSKEFGRYGRELTQICRNRHIAFTYVPDAKWGKVHAYPLWLMKEYFHIQAG